jgi:cytochrome c biogenesis protein CcmG/thiol:disulfide interchange protein DsbE
LTTPAGARRAAARQSPNATGLATIEYGKVTPDFVYDDGDGPKKLSDALGSPVLIHFWDTWCGPCTDELPLIARAHKEAPQLVIITLSDEAPGVARAYLKKEGIDLPVSEDAEHKVFRSYSVHAIPVSVFLRADGTVEHVSVGAMDWPEIASALGGLGVNLDPAPSAVIPFELAVVAVDC